MALTPDGDSARAQTRSGAILSAIALVLLALAVVLIVWWPMISTYPQTPEGDGRYAYFQVAIAKAEVVFYNEFPLWNPFDCAGLPLWDYPEAMTASPILLAMSGVSTMPTYYVWNVLHAVVGFVSMWLLTRIELKSTRIAAFAAASLFTLAACHTAQYASAHETFVAFWNAPLLILLWRRSDRSWKCAVGFGLVLAWMVYDGATYPLPYTLILLLTETLTRVWPLARLKRVILAGLVASAVGLSVGASRLIPLASQFARHPRVLGVEAEYLHWNSVVAMFTMRESHWYVRLPDQTYVWGEYVAYLGYLVIAIAIIGLVASGTEHLWILLLAVVTFVTMLGRFSDFAPWALLKLVFPFKSMRVPSRFRLPFMMFPAMWIALAIDRAPRRLQRWLGSGRAKDAARAAIIGIALLGIGDVASLSHEIIDSRFKAPPPAKVIPSARFHYSPTGDFADTPYANRAWTGCRAYEFAPNLHARIWTGDVPQAHAKEGNEGDVAITSATRTHNTFTVTFNATRPTRILLNSAHDAGWRSDVGTVVDDGSLLALDVPAGEHTAHLHYWPLYMTLGVTLSLLGLAGSVAFLLRRQKRA